MHAVSDGERRRVQLCMGLLRPWRVLLLDEITVDLDLLTRAEFLGWLKGETERRECTIVYATHILDNLAGWPSHLVHMHLGKVKEWGTMKRFEEEKLKREGEGGGKDGIVKKARESGNSKLGELVLEWLREDLKDRGPRERTERGGEGKTYESHEGKGGFGFEKRD